MAVSDTTEYRWTVEAGEDEILVVPVLDASGNPTSIAGGSVDARIKDRPGGTTYYEWPDELATIESGGTEVHLKVPATVSETWAFTSAWYRVVVTTPGGSPTDQRILEGDFIVSPG